METSVLEEIHGNDTLIVSFGGYAQKIGGILVYEFLNFLTKHFPQTDKLFLKDTYSSSYHRGIEGISKNVEQTAEYLRTKIEGRNVYDVSGVSYKTPYTSVLFLGNSGGGYSAILFASLLNVKNCLAFVPQTILRKPDKDPKYKDLKGLINSTTNYQLYGDTSIKFKFDPHHISHCEHISEFPNVTINRLEKVDLKQLRDSGKLFEIINEILLN